MRKYLHLFVFILFATDVYSQDVDTNLWITNGPVHALLRKDSLLFVGGSFDDVGPYTGSLVAVDSSGNRYVNFPKTDGIIDIIEPDSNGGWYVAGLFSRIGNYPLSNLARINSNFTVDPLFSPNPNGRVRCMAFGTRNNIYVGGDFTSIGTTPLNYAAEIDDTTGLPVTHFGSSGPYLWDPSPDSAIYALAIGDRTSSFTVDTLTWDTTYSYYCFVYMGGNFNDCGGWAASPNIRKVDDSAGHYVSYPLHNEWNALTNGRVRTIEIMDTLVFIAGDFTTANATPRNRFAILDDNYNDVDGVFLVNSSTSFAGNVYSISLTDTSMFAWGNFSQVNSQPRSYVAYFNLSIDTLPAVNTVSISLKPWSVFPGSNVYGVSVSDSKIYLAGNFTAVNTVNRKHAAAVSEQGASLLNWNPHCSGDAKAICAKGDTIIIGGSFLSVGGVDRTNLAQLSLNTGKTTNWNPAGASNVVLCFDTIGNTLYAGGNFNSLAGIGRNHLAGIDIYSGVLNSFNPNVNGSVRCITHDNSNFYFGGLFTNVGIKARNNIAAANIATGNVTDWNPNVNGTVNSIVVSGGKAFLAGYFTQAGYFLRSRLAKADTTTGAIDFYWNPDANEGVYSIIEDGGYLYTGGFFTSIGGQSRNNICKIDMSTTGSVLGWNPSANGRVRKLLKCNDTLYACGDFTNIDGQNIQRLARFDLNTGSVMNWNPAINNSVLSVCQGMNKIYAGGNFSSVNGFTRYYLSNIGWLNTVGFSEITNPHSSLLLYPNPNNGEFSVLLPDDSPNENIVSIYNLTGEKILEETISDNSFVINISQHAKGIYFIRVQSGSALFSQKLIIH